MRMVVLGVCIFAAACGENSPSSPTGAASQATSGTTATATLQNRAATQLPFKGSFTGSTVGLLNCPPTCPPTILTVNGRFSGEGTHLGAFTATDHDVVDLATGKSTGGSFVFTAADGDRLLTSTTGGEDAFTPPNISHVVLTATIVSGTGRFASASGTFPIEFTQTIDYAAGTSSVTGSFDGQISLNR